MAYIDPNQAAADPNAAANQLTRAQYQDWLDRYKPVEDQAVSLVQQDTEPLVQRAGDAVGRAYDASAGATQRNLSRYGITADESTTAAIARRRGLMRALDVAKTNNNLRNTLEDARVAGLGQLIDIGRNVNNSATQNLSSAASLQTARENAGAQNAAAASGARKGLFGTVLGVGASAATFL